MPDIDDVHLDRDAITGLSLRGFLAMCPLMLAVSPSWPLPLVNVQRSDQQSFRWVTYVLSVIAVSERSEIFPSRVSFSLV